MMMGRDSGKPAVAGGPAPHIPVLGPRAVELLAVREGGFYVDATFGAGGHSRAILAAGNVKILGLDRDPAVIALGADLVERAAGRLTLVQANFADLDSVAHEFGLTAADGVLLDLGVSSMQLDHAERGFSFRLEGPLDMRMSSSGASAADILARASERDLAAIIATLGEERHARAVARAIAAARQRQAIRTTSELATIVARVVRGRPGDIHPATRTFQALRIFVNDELRSLAEALGAAERLLAPGGRLVTIAFHSLEDRIVKTFLAARGRPAAPSRHLPERVRAAPSFQILTRRPVVPDDAELEANPRARSAKLMLRVLHIGVFAALVLAAADVYKIKFDSTLQAERVAKLRAEIRRERDAVAALRAEWTALDGPERIQALARRHLPLKPIDITQLDNLDQLPDRPIDLVPPVDGLGPMVDIEPHRDRPTGSISEAR